MPSIFETYVDGAVRAAELAKSELRPGIIRFSAGEFAADEPVAFNRSIRAYNRNPEVARKSRRERHLAVDREMTLLRFEDETGKPIALWNWFSVHATSMHRDRHRIHSDNKGLAAEKVEAEFAKKGHPDFVAVFAQGAAGDVSPNYRYYRGLREKRGSDRDDDISCDRNASLQANQALKLYERAAASPPLFPSLANILEYHDLSKVRVSPEHAGGRTDLVTGPAEFGTPQLYGTAEGRGAPRLLIELLRGVIKVCQLYNYFLDRFESRPAHWPWREHPVQGNKVRVIGAGQSEIFETGRIRHLVFPDWSHPTIRMLKKWGRVGQTKERPFCPQILPLQICRIGDLAIFAVPAEFTTVAGARLRRTLESALAHHGVSRAILQGYANAYSSYVVTPEEYLQQGYEGGCTLFGRWTLPAYQTLFTSLAQKFARKEAPSAVRPLPPSTEHMRMISGGS